MNPQIPGTSNFPGNKVDTIRPAPLVALGQGADRHQAVRVPSLAMAGLFALTACSSPGTSTRTSRDHESGGGQPVYQPMLVVPLPSLARVLPTGRSMEALQARQTPFGDILLALFKDSDINLLVDPGVQARECTFDIKKSTVEETFDALLHSLDLGYQWDGSFLRIRDTVQETLHVDILDAAMAQGAAMGGAMGGGMAGGMGAGMAGGAGAAGVGGQGGGVAGFWDELQTAIPQLLGDTAKFVVNRSSSALHVEARPSGVAKLREMIDTSVRRANKQVSLEARVLEVRLDDAHSLGVNWSLLPQLFNSNKTGLAGGGAVAAQTAASGGTAFRFGILDTGDFSVFVDALQTQGEVRVLSSPRVSTMNNQPASINITDQIPIITRDIINAVGVSQTQYGVEFADVGVQLQVQPMIGEDGILSVAITPQIREQTGTVVTPDGLVSAPIISQRQATTLVRVADGQAIALGGLRSTRKNETRNGIPFLMDIPWLGQLFSSTVQTRVEVELMILLTPRVLDDTWIDEEVRRGSHRLVQLRRGFQWNSIDLEGFRPEDWQGGSLQGRAMAASEPEIRRPDNLPVAPPADAGLTVTRRGLASHLLSRAQGELDRGQLHAALATIERALALDPTDPDGLVAAGVLHSRLGNLGKARAALDRAVGLHPDNVVALTARGAVELADGSPYAARRYMERAHALGQTTLTAANLGGAVLALGEVAAAREFLRGTADPKAPPELHANLAYAELATGHVPEARESLRRALVGGADARNPRLVALTALVEAAEQQERKQALEGVKQGR
jgi:MSHA biogenesis protein MshL